MNTYQTLSYRQTCALLCTLGGGTSGFDHKQYTLAQLRGFIAEWIRTGAIDAAYVESVSAGIVAAGRPAPVTPPAPHFAPIPAPPFVPVAQPEPVAAAVPAPPAPVAAQPEPVAIPVFMPEPVAAAVPAPAQPEPVAIPVFVPEPVAAVPVPVPAPAQPAPDPQIGAMPAPLPAPLPAAAQSFAVRALFTDAPALAKHLPENLMTHHWASPQAPAVDPSYIFDASTLTQALIALNGNLPIWCVGEKGTGKSQFAIQLAARTGRPFCRINFDRNLERAEFLGSMSLVNGSTVWADGALLKAMRTPGCIILLDELSYGQQGNLAVLNSILEMGGEFTIADTGECVRMAPGVVFIAADNTNGSGDVTGRYHGTHALNSATVDRFGPMLRFDYLSAAQETKLIVNRTGCPSPLAGRIVEVLRTAREKAASSGFADAPSLRRALFWATLMHSGVEPGVAYESTVVEFAAIEAQEALRQIMRAVFVPDAAPAAANPFAPAQ